MSRELDVYYNDQLAGQLIQSMSGQLMFQYQQEYVESQRPALSLSLPLSYDINKSENVAAFFSGILPDEIARQRIAKSLGLSEKNSFALLEAIGGECAGALSFYPKGQKKPEAKKLDFEILDEQKLKNLLSILSKRPLLAGEEGIRLSLAGAQAKVAVVVENSRVKLVRGSSPTTHIIKPAIHDIPDSVHNEFFCMRLAKLVGIEAAEVDVGLVEDVPYLIIERYDRELDKHGHWQRLHQEDFCQAVGIRPELKYQAEGGPSIAQCKQVIEASCQAPAKQYLMFLQRIIFNYLIGNADAHGKNFSLLYVGNKPVLSPAYDVMNTAVYDDLTDKMAMKIGSEYKPQEVLLRHWHKLVPDTRLAQKNLDELLSKYADQAVIKATALADALNSKNLPSPVYQKVIDVIAQRAALIIKRLE